ncbi:DNA polymerase III subunit beta [Aquirhabdus parva]|uniref:Beta sliding clamp n=1 Tax=Aquirhabdus parva TaxID=2283318 RepID=A0A345PAP3_9GAMM|nr:DNA polymerase III subunit beta [Aquirhabdus parva]AXI04352.1 DNA polymerase III subunit beta [Aquirhabdus parva]AXI04396.1 DNA polymerase III subunit beta [Aquirhabdus parva]
MNITILGTQIASDLAALSPAIHTKSTMPILSNVALTVSHGVLTMRGTNTEIEIETSRTLDGEFKEGSCAVNNYAFTNIIKRLSTRSKPINIFLDENRTLHIECGKAALTLQTALVEDLPSIDRDVKQVAQLDLEDPKDFTSALKAVLPFVAHNDVRYYLTGVALQMDKDSITLIASNGHRLASFSLPITTGVAASLIIPAPTVKTIVQLISNAKEKACCLQLQRSTASFTVDRVKLTTKLIDGKYPDWKRIVPRGDFNTVLNRHELTQAVEIATAGYIADSSKSFCAIAITPCKDRLLVNYTERHGSGSGNEECIATLTENLDHTICIDRDYVLDAMKFIDSEDVKIFMPADSHAALRFEPVDGADCQITLSPMRA